MTQYEYRVRWRRQGSRWNTRIVQRIDTARRKALGIIGVEALRDEIPSLQAWPELRDVPVIQRREVGTWEDFEPPPELTEAKMTSLREWAEGRYETHDYGPF